MLDKDTIISLANEAGIKGPAPARQGFKMYASPQRLMKFAGLVTSKREWVGLTDEEKEKLVEANVARELDMQVNPPVVSKPLPWSA